MANISILAAFERMWQHIAAALNGKSDTSHTHDLATTDTAGFMSTTQVQQLSSVQNNISYINLQLPNKADKTHTHTAEEIGAAPSTHEHDLASSDEDGFMSMEDKTYLDSLNENVNVVEEQYVRLKWGLVVGDTAEVVDGETCSAAIGYNVISNNRYQTVVGKYNNLQLGATNVSSTDGSAFIVGVGTGDEALKNGFRVSFAGKCYGTSSFTGAGADYAEYYEWLDGNPNNEDRRGYFVTFEGNKIRKAAAEDDYILGVISATPVVVGNSHSEGWKNMYLTDIFGENLTEIVEVPETTNEETGKTIPAHTETRFIINPEYDHTREYKGRDQRQEWAAVGTHGQLIVIDDGTCEINRYCKVANDGKATKSDNKTEYRVIERLDDTHIKIVIK